MSMSAKKQSANRKASGSAAKKPARTSTIAAKSTNAPATSKQSRVIAMLRSSAGATIGAMMKETDWQQHSVRGFLAGVVTKRLKLKLDSAKVDGTRVYRIATEAASKPTSRRPAGRTH